MPRGTVAALSLALLLPAPAFAQDGVTYDPDSPAGREYALPLERERQKSAPRRDAGQLRLFGDGVSRDESAPAGGAGGATGGSGGAGSGAGGTSAGQPSAGSAPAAGPAGGAGGPSAPGGGAEPVVPPVERVVPASSGPTGGSAGIATGGGIALAALLVGTLARRRLHTPR